MKGYMLVAPNRYVNITTFLLFIQSLKRSKIIYKAKFINEGVFIEYNTGQAFFKALTLVDTKAYIRECRIRNSKLDNYGHPKN